MIAMIVANSTNCVSRYVTGFVKRGLPHSSDFTYLKDCNFLLMHGMNLKFSLYSQRGIHT